MSAVPAVDDATIVRFAQSAAEQVPGTVLVTLAGSRAYGTHRPGSDLDLSGVYVAPLSQVLGLAPPPKTRKLWDRDVTLFELSHFCKLAASANPTILEVLWGPALVRTLDGGRLRVRRRMFLSRRVVKTYGGYAIQQLRKAEAGSGGSRGREHFKREKFLMHTLRLAEAGLHVIRTGELLVKVPDPEDLWARASRPLERVTEDVMGVIARMDEEAPRSPLPECPDVDGIDRLLYEIRMDGAGGER